MANIIKCALKKNGSVNVYASTGGGPAISSSGRALTKDNTIDGKYFYIDKDSKDSYGRYKLVNDVSGNAVGKNNSYKLTFATDPKSVHVDIKQQSVDSDTWDYITGKKSKPITLMPMQIDGFVPMSADQITQSIIDSHKIPSTLPAGAPSNGTANLESPSTGTTGTGTGSGDIRIQDRENVEFVYTEDVEKKIDATFSAMQSFDDLKHNSRIMGAPFQFTEIADARIHDSSEDFYVGRQYVENILAEAPIIYIMPGKPAYLGDVKDRDKSVIENYIQANNNSDSNEFTEDVMEKITSIEGRYFTFEPDFRMYIRYVNLLCRACSIYLGIGDKIVPGSDEKYRNYDWGKWTNPQYKADKEEGNTGDRNIFEVVWDGAKYMWDSIVNYAKNFTEEVFQDYNYLKMYVDPGINVADDAGNTTRTSKVAGLFDTAQEWVKEARFLTDGSMLGGLVDSIGDLGGALTDVLGHTGTSNLQMLLRQGEQVLDGSNLLFPEMWGDSSWGANSYNFSLNLVSPYGDTESIYLNIIVPMMHVLALGCPHQDSEGANTYNSPFLVRLFAKGWFSCDMGMITNISISKGGNGDAWSVTGLPTEVKIDISVSPLYSTMFIPHAGQPAEFFANQGLIDFLAVTCGVIITKTNLYLKVATIISVYANSLFDIPSTIYDSFVQGISNSVKPLFML